MVKCSHYIERNQGIIRLPMKPTIENVATQTLTGSQKPGGPSVADRVNIGQQSSEFLDVLVCIPDYSKKPIRRECKKTHP